jgi:predicted acylesterase/phospholipase RssA/CRP-like cAMP-binding protein
VSRPDLADEIALAATERLGRNLVAEMLAELVDGREIALIDDVLAVMEWRRLETGENLFRQGDPADAAYFVVSGRLGVTERRADGTRVLLREVGKGAMVGELGLIDNAQRSATVHALRDATLARLSGDAFSTLVTRHPSFALHVTRAVIERLQKRSPSARSTSVAVAFAATIEPLAFLTAMAEEIRRFGSTSLLRNEDVGRLLGEQFATERSDLFLTPRLADCLHREEVSNDFVLYAADPTSTVWTRRCMRGADRAVIVVSAHPGAREDRDIRAFVADLEGLDHVSICLAVLHAGGSEPGQSAALLERYGAHEVVHLRLNNGADIARLARLVTGNGIGLVLGGGGARGFAHIGVYRALCDQGVPIDAIGGASIGAPIAAAIALGPDVDPGELEIEVTRQFHRLLDYTVPIVSLLKGARISKHIAQSLGDRDIKDLWRRFFCVSTNLTTAELEVHRRGPLGEAVRASVAIPGVLPPVPRGEHLLVDGGVLANLPVAQMRDDPMIGTVISVNVTSPAGPRARVDFGHSVSGWRAVSAALGRRRSPYPKLSSVLLRTMIIGSLRGQESQPGPNDLSLEIDLKGVGLLAFESVSPVSRAGYEASLAPIGAWRDSHLPRSA